MEGSCEYKGIEWKNAEAYKGWSSSLEVSRECRICPLRILTYPKLQWSYGTFERDKKFIHTFAFKPEMKV
jgi:hypothetical protein